MNMKENKYYTITGKEDAFDSGGFPVVDKESSHIYAQCICEKKPRSMTANSSLGVDNIGYKYYIAINSQRQAYNPLSKTCARATFVDRICKNSKSHTMKEVNQYVFNKYIGFLKTGNEKALTDINRDLNT